MDNINGAQEYYMEGAVLLFDKPLEWTSFDMVKKVKALLRHCLAIKKIKVGHAGTLDPLASGLLIICTGKMTKQIDTIQRLEKEYSGTFFIGATTPSADLETQPDAHFPVEHIDSQMLEQARKSFTGCLQQVPPLYSAKKINGERAYEHARRGDKTIMQPNTVNIHQFELTRIALPEVDFRVICSKGTYIRSLARDFGETLQSGAYLQKLRRTRIGSYEVKDAWSPDDFANSMKQWKTK